MVLRFEVGKGGEIWVDNLGKKISKIRLNIKFCRITMIVEYHGESSFNFL